MEYKIIEMDQFQLIGLKTRVTINKSGVNEEIKAFNASVTPAIRNELLGLSSGELSGIINGSLNYENRDLDGIGKMDRLIGVVSDVDCPDQYISETVPAATWVVLKVEGVFPAALHTTWSEFYQWLPTSGYEKYFEIELTRHLTPAIPGNDYYGDIWIPVRTS